MTSPQVPQPQRATVLTMPPRAPQPPDDRKNAPANLEHTEVPDEPGYGHGV